MNKEEILERSRKENKNRDYFELEVQNLASKYACIVAAILASIFFITQIVVGEGINCGLYAIVFSGLTTNFWVKYIKMHKKHELFVAICYTVFVVFLTVAHIYNLITSSTIM